ncbi:MAG: hypothetical protein LBH93_05615 [Chitinispirillales bacterium]|jgi:hypothetical protein|nr:hypothetical protein [Chitinispirillales bacterium]
MAASGSNIYAHKSLGDIITASNERENKISTPKRIGIAILIVLGLAWFALNVIVAIVAIIGAIIGAIMDNGDSVPLFAIPIMLAMMGGFAFIGLLPYLLLKRWPEKARVNALRDIERCCVFCAKVPVTEGTHCSECGAKMYNSREDLAILINDTLELLTQKKGDFELKEGDDIKQLKMVLTNVRQRYVNLQLNIDLDTANESLKKLSSDTNLTDFFNNANLCINHTSRLKRAKEIMPLKVDIGVDSNDIVATLIDAIETEKPRIIKRGYDATVHGALELKTERGRNKRLSDYLSMLVCYKKELEYLDEYKMVVNEIKLKIGEQGEAI